MAEVLVTAALRDYLGSVSHRRFDWTDCNCFTICADWVATVTGRDPMAPWRHVSSKAQARRVVRQAGGDLALVARAMCAFGAPPTPDPKIGDIALVKAPTGKRGAEVLYRPAGAICIGGGSFAILTADMGLVLAPMDMLAAWSIDY
jgi:hypothetical protein